MHQYFLGLGTCRATGLKPSFKPPDAQDAATLERVTGDSLAMMEEAVYSTGFLDFPVSLVAAGVLVSARRAAGAWPFWPAALALLTGAHLCQAMPYHARRCASHLALGAAGERLRS